MLRCFRQAILLVASLLTSIACNEQPVRITEPKIGIGPITFQVLLGSGYLNGSLQAQLDQATIAPIRPSLSEAAFEVQNLAPGRHTITATANFQTSGVEKPERDTRLFTAPARKPALAASSPANGAKDVPRTEWIWLDFNRDPARDDELPAFAEGGFELFCQSGVETEPQKIDIHRVDPEQIVINPKLELPSGRDCSLRWLEESKSTPVSLNFQVSSAGAPVELAYDRDQPYNCNESARLDPFPDDFFTAENATTTGLKLAVPCHRRGEDSAPAGALTVERVFKALRKETNELDGFSPVAHFTLELPDAVDPISIPTTPAESLKPEASIVLLDVDRDSPTFSSRIPFKADTYESQGLNSTEKVHNLLIFPAYPLEPGGRYALIVTKRVLLASKETLAPSPFFRAVVDPNAPGQTEAVTRARSLITEVFPLLEDAQKVSPPIPREDIALALRISVRTTSGIPQDLLAVKQQVLNSNLQIRINTCEAGPSSDIVAVLRGSWDAPDWRIDAQNNPNFARDANGLLRPYAKTRSKDFVIAMPSADAGGNPVGGNPIPLILYQHGNPPRTDEAVNEAGLHLAKSGFAVAGFRDEIVETYGEDPRIQTFGIFLHLLQRSKLPDVWTQTNADQISFLYALRKLNSALSGVTCGGKGPFRVVDHLTRSSPFGYVGVSQGAFHGPGLLPFAPEIKAAALVVGSAPLAETLLHQLPDVFLDPEVGFRQFLPDFHPTEILTALSLFQTIFDRQESHNLGRFLYREPLPVPVAGGSTSKTKPSILIVEGLYDPQVPNHGTESSAWQVGPIPHLEPVQREVPFLVAQKGPLSGNIDTATTAAFYQFVPDEAPGVPPSPGCERNNSGHSCAYLAPAARQQRANFLKSALLGSATAPTITDPYDSSTNVENEAPLLHSLATQVVPLGETLEFRVAAWDPNGDEVFLSTLNLNDFPGATFDASSGIFRWTPPPGTHKEFFATFSATDQLSLPTSNTVRIAVDRAPVLTVPASQSAAPGEILRFEVQVSDPDGDSVEVSLGGITPSPRLSTPSVKWNTNTKKWEFEWALSPKEQQGFYAFTLRASDGILETEKSVSIFVCSDSQQIFCP